MWQVHRRESDPAVLRPHCRCSQNRRHRYPRIQISCAAGPDRLRASGARALEGSVHDNIAYGKKGVTEEQVLEAAKLANADEFIARMPHGYDTMIGERGETLSGGQRQRIGIARAIIRNNPILILDEPTAALDTESESLVMEALDRLMKGRTVITIAHRLSTIRDADKIVVLKGGSSRGRG
jgi:ABC-type multidrug transport system fused ATPase/permease subunit